MSYVFLIYIQHTLIILIIVIILLKLLLLIIIIIIIMIQGKSVWSLHRF